MKTKALPRCICWLNCFVFFTAAPFIHAQSLPEGKGKPEFERLCSNCHTVAISTRVGRTHEEWAGVVNEMVSRGAQGSRNDLDAVVDYLATSFGKGYSATPGAAPSQTPSPGIMTKTLPSVSQQDAAKAKELIANNNCLSCHRLDNVGSYQGPHLDGLGVHRTPEQIRSAMVAPSAAVSPENRTVRLVTRAGKTVNGRILNQDGFSVELIDTSSQLMAFQKADLREFTILDKNSMPSYEGKMSAEDLAILIRYLSSLDEVSK